MDTVSKAKKYLCVADNYQNQFDWFGFSRKANILAARDAYNKAAVVYKNCKQYQNAAQCYQKAAQCDNELKDIIETKYCWTEAAKLYSMSNDIESAMHAYKMAIEINLKSDRFYQAARLQCQLADMLIVGRMFEKAIDTHQNAAIWYKTEQDTTNANQCIMKIGELYAKTFEYNKAIDTFENLAQIVLDKRKRNRLSWKVTEYFFKSLLCHLVIESKKDSNSRSWTSVEQTTNQYKTKSPIFKPSLECKFIENVIRAAQKLNFDQFISSKKEMKQSHKLDAISQELILRLEYYFRENIEMVNENNDDSHQIEMNQELWDETPFDQVPDDQAPDLSKLQSDINNRVLDQNLDSTAPKLDAL